MKGLTGVLSFRDRRRKWISYTMIALICLLSLTALYPLFSIFYFVLERGIQHLNWNFLTQLPKPVGEIGGGMGNALLGSIKLIFLGSLLGVPWGLAAGIYMSEYEEGRSTKILRFTTDLLMGVPSIVVGIFVYAICVKPMGGFSVYAGALALAIIMMPIIARSTEEMLRTVPQHYREAGLALGVLRWKVILKILVRARWGAILTGIVLSLARIAGETAPLLFTSFNNQYWSQSLNAPVASLPVQIYTYAISPYEEWQLQAWTGALVLILFVFFINLFVRIIFSQVREFKD